MCKEFVPRGVGGEVGGIRAGAFPMADVWVILFFCGVLRGYVLC